MTVKNTKYIPTHASKRDGPVDCVYCERDGEVNHDPAHVHVPRPIDEGVER